MVLGESNHFQISMEIKLSVYFDWDDKNAYRFLENFCKKWIVFAVLSTKYQLRWPVWHLNKFIQHDLHPTSLCQMAMELMSM